MRRVTERATPRAAAAVVVLVVLAVAAWRALSDPPTASAPRTPAYTSSRIAVDSPPSPSPIRTDPTDPHRLGGRLTLVDEAGEPVCGAVYNVETRERSLVPLEGLSLDGLRGAFVAHAPGLLPSDPVCFEDSSEDVRIDLHAGRTVATHVVGPRGDPIADATVCISSVAQPIAGLRGIPVGQMRPTRQRVVQTALTDGSGHAVLTGLPEDQTLFVEGHKYGYLRSATQIVRAGTDEVELELHEIIACALSVDGDEILTYSCPASLPLDRRTERRLSALEGELVAKDPAIDLVILGARTESPPPTVQLTVITRRHGSFDVTLEAQPLTELEPRVLVVNDRPLPDDLGELILHTQSIAGADIEIPAGELRLVPQDADPTQRRHYGLPAVVNELIRVPTGRYRIVSGSTFLTPLLPETLPTVEVLAGGRTEATIVCRAEPAILRIEPVSMTGATISGFDVQVSGDGVRFAGSAEGRDGMEFTTARGAVLDVLVTIGYRPFQKTIVMDRPSIEVEAVVDR